MNMKRILTAVLLVAILVIGYFWLQTRNVTVTAELPVAETTAETTTVTAETTTDAPSEASEPTNDPVVEANAITVPDMILGNPDAKVTVTEYASFTCPHCRNFHTSVFNLLKTNYIDTGKIKFVYREVYFDKFGLWAGLVARCGGEAKYFGISDLIYKQQSEWLNGGNDPVQIGKNLRTIAKTAGLDDAALDQCLNDGAMAEAMVAEFQKNAVADDISGTPTFIINGTKYSNMAYAEFAKILDDLLAE